MGVLDDLLGALNPIDVDGPMGGRRGRKVLERGERASATVVGIEVTGRQLGEHGGETNDFVFAYALDVRGPAGPFRAGVRQRLGAERWRAHLGAEVKVAVDGSQVIIDWQQTLEAWGLEGETTNTHSWKMLDRPPREGVTDRHGDKERRRIAELTPAEATVVGDHGASFLGMESRLTRMLDVELRLPDGRLIQQRTARLHPPDYVRHRLRPGVVVRAGYDPQHPERIRFDWLALANEPLREAPVPEWAGPPAPETREPDPMELAGRVAGAFGVKLPDLEAAGASPPPETAAAAVHGASFDRWVELKAQMEAAGVGRKQRDAWVAAREPTVTSWKDLDRHWTQAMRRDPALADRFAARYGRAVQAALPGGASSVGP